MAATMRNKHGGLTQKAEKMGNVCQFARKLKGIMVSVIH